MKTYFAVPEVSSLDTNEIKDLSLISQRPEQIRIVQLLGIPVRIELNVDNYVEIKSYKELKLKDYSKLFENLLSYFYNTTYLFGFVNNENLYIYDIYTNENFLSTFDFEFLESNFNLPIVKPIIEGSFTVSYLIELLNKKVNGEKMDFSTIHFLPTVYINDKRETITKKNTISKIIFGEKKAYSVWTGSYNTYAGNNSLYTAYVPKNETVYTLTTKEERASIFSETYKNVSKYFQEHEKEATEQCKEWWKKYGKTFTHLYSIHTLPKTRKLVYDYSKSFTTTVASTSDIEVKWAELFTEFFLDNYPKEMEKIPYSLDTMFYFAFVFKDELKEFDKFFVKETDTKDDWRYKKYYTGGCYDDFLY